MATSIRRDNIQMRHKRLRKKVTGTPERPRLAVHFSGKHIYAQVIDDSVGKTIASVNTTEAGLKAVKPRANAVTATTVGKLEPRLFRTTRPVLVSGISTIIDVNPVMAPPCWRMAWPR